MLDKILEILLYVPRKIFSFMVDGLIDIFNQIPVPDFMQHADLSGLGFWDFFLYLSLLYVGMAMVTSSYVARFLVRRIPFIG